MANNKTPIDAGMLDRAISGIKYVFTGKPNEWFGPGVPVKPQAQEGDGVVGRAFDFRTNYNVDRSTKSSENGINYDQLRAFADGYDLLRLIIETRKDQMSKLKYTFSYTDEKKQPDAKIDELKAFFKYPDQEHDWDTWLRMMVEDMLVIDATTIYPRKTLGGEPYAFELVDGSTIKRVLDSGGRTPVPPEVAYQQILKGVVASDYNRDELIFRPRNVRTNKVYGYSPVEQVIMTVNIAMRRQVHQLQYYTEGNVPEMIVGVPETWSVTQIETFQKYWDSIIEGNTAARRHMKFVPGELKNVPTKDVALKDGYDEWLARIICFAFSVSPQALIAQMNRATAETAQNQALQEGLAPIQNWVKSLIDFMLVKHFGISDIEFKWEEEDDTSPETQMKVLTGYVQAKIMDEDEARAKLGLDPLTDEQRERMKPAVPPALAAFAEGEETPGGGVSTGTDPIAPGSTTESDDDPIEESPVGKSASSGLLKVKKLPSRNRTAKQNAIATINQILKSALAEDAGRIASEINGKIGKAEHDRSPEELARDVILKKVRESEPELADQMAIIFDDGAELAVKQVLGDITEDQLEQVHVQAVKYAKSRTGELITEIEESTRDLIKNDLALALEEGWGNTEIRDALMENYAFSETRANMVARTELAFADVQGNIAGWKESGVVKSKQWISSAGCCDNCAALDNVTVDLDDQFPDGGGDGPPFHPNCECDVIPIVED